jgi:AraC-like DNA-binding protein
VPSVYRELLPPPALRRHLACAWLSHDDAVRVLPDGCVDVVFSAERLIVAGPATAASLAPATPGRMRFGVRFRIGSAGAVLGVPVSELLDDDVPLSELWGADARRLETRVRAAEATAGADEPLDALAALVYGVAERALMADQASADRLVRDAVLTLVRGSSLQKTADVLGLGDRQLRRRFDAAVGYGPATLVRIHRFQRFLALAERHRGLPLARLAVDSGYADQAHLSRECRRLAGVSPTALLADGPIAAGEKAVLSAAL